MSRDIPSTYKTTNWPAYNEALKRRGSLTIWFDPEMIWGATTEWQTWPTAILQRYRHPSLSDDEGAVRHGATADDRVRREPVASDRFELGGARLEHAIAPPEDAGREHPISLLQRPTASADR